MGAYYKEGMKPGAHPGLGQVCPRGAGRAGRGQDRGATTPPACSAREEAQAAGYTQVLWLDGVEHRYLDEVGTMNIMVRIGDEVITPPLAGAILAGVTRDSVADAAARLGAARVSERPIAIDEVIAGRAARARCARCGAPAPPR